MPLGQAAGALAPWQQPLFARRSILCRSGWPTAPFYIPLLLLTNVAASSAAATGCCPLYGQAPDCRPAAARRRACAVAALASQFPSGRLAPRVAQMPPFVGSHKTHSSCGLLLPAGHCCQPQKDKLPPPWPLPHLKAIAFPTCPFCAIFAWHAQLAAFVNRLAALLPRPSGTAFLSHTHWPEI